MLWKGVLLTGVIAVSGCVSNPVLVMKEQDCEITRVNNSHGYQEFKRCSSSAVIDDSKTEKELNLMEKNEARYE